MKSSEQTEVQSPNRETVGTFIWRADVPPRENCEALAKLLAMSPDLYRPIGKEGLLVLTRTLEVEEITTPKQFWPVALDRVNVVVVNAKGDPTGNCIPSQHQEAILHSELSLKHFLPVDDIVCRPIYLADFQLVERGYNQSDDGRNYLYIGPEPKVSRDTTFISPFLDAMDFATEADRTNAVAAALTVVLRNHWLGAKPIILVTATKSHGGKDTVVSFATGVEKSVAISYQSKDWALERSFVGAVKWTDEVGVVVVENARISARHDQIASAFLERFATDPRPFLFSTGTGKATRRDNDIVIAISTNYGLVSEDLMNRALPIHLQPVGNVFDRTSPIGNPRFEYLPEHREDIAAELRGMIERWREEGMPLDGNAKHSASVWAKTIGGILEVNGFGAFLGNYGTRRTMDDPVRDGLGILGAARPDQWLRPGEWATVASQLGVAKKILPPGDQDSHAAKERGIGKVMSAHQDETFMLETEGERFKLHLAKSRKRLDGEPAKVRYRFTVLEREPLPED